jgi:AraC-like DNA-binding protein
MTSIAADAEFRLNRCRDFVITGRHDALATGQQAPSRSQLRKMVDTGIRFLIGSEHDEMKDLARPRNFSIDPSWRIILRNLGIRPADVTRQARLPDDLIGQSSVGLSRVEYFNLWRALGEVAADPLLPLRLPEVLSFDVFDPAIFAVSTCPNLKVALARLSHYKRLTAAMAVHVHNNEHRTRVTLDWRDDAAIPPAILAATELVVLVSLFRRATRVEIIPLEVTTTVPLAPERAYEEYFGVCPKLGDQLGLTFARYDAERPFLTGSDGLWNMFEPDLRRRLADLEGDTSAVERAKAALVELLPAGRASIEQVAERLGVGTRSLQRKLKEQGTTFQCLLSSLRERLARHYLTTTQLSGGEISFLLGFEDPNSFFRAFASWTGQTPESVRRGRAAVRSEDVNAPDLKPRSG